MKKRILDVIMILLMPLLMSYSLAGETLHEIFGVCMFAAWIVHHVLNRGFVKSLGKGRYNARRVISTALDALLFLDMLAMVVSALLISKHLFTFLGIHTGAAFGRQLHILGAYWGYVLMSLHLGFHLRTIGAAMGISKRKGLLRALQVLGVLIGLYGAWVFIRRQIPAYLFGSVMFVNIDPSESLLPFLLDYLAMMIFFAQIPAWIGVIAARRKTAEVRSEEKKMKEKKPKSRKKLIILCGILVIALIAGAIWGIPYVRRHFTTARVDMAQATAMAPVELPGESLVVYFTRLGNTAFDKDVDATSSASLMLDGDELIGNAQLLAAMICNATGAEASEILVTDPYPSSYGATVSRAKTELSGGQLELAGGMPDVSNYDRVFLVFPLWWWTAPKAVESFLLQNDLTGMPVYTVITHGGSGAGTALEDMRAVCGADFKEPVLTVYDDDVDEARDQVAEWLRSL